jgi:heme-degrading monooxygenase HmoA
MIAVISKFTIQNGMEAEVKNAFQNRPQLVEKAIGFLKMDVISPLDNPSEIQLITYWQSIEKFESWHKLHLKSSHQLIPKGLKLVPHSWSLSYFEHVTS